MKNLLIILLFFTALSLSIFAQTPQKMEQDLVATINQIDKYSTYGGNYDDEKLSAADKAFEEKLLKYTKNAATLKYNFPKLRESVTIITSEDGKFRTYSWDEGTGGTMHDYSVVYQYQGTDGKVYSRTNEKSSEEEEDEDSGGGGFINNIYTVNVAGGNIYIVCSTFVASTIDHYESADLYKIEGSTLNDKVELFKTKEGLTNSIGFEYDFFSVADRKERPIKLILYDKATKTVKIPIVIQDKKSPVGRVTNRFINYKFDGKYFVRVS